MGAHQVDISLGDGPHADLVIGSGEESSECAGKSNGTVTGGAADGNSHLQQPREIFKLILKTDVPPMASSSKRLGLSRWRMNRNRLDLFGADYGTEEESEQRLSRLHTARQVKAAIFKTASEDGDIYAPCSVQQ